MSAVSRTVAGVTTVYYKVTHANYTTVMGSTTITVIAVYNLYLKAENADSMWEYYNPGLAGGSHNRYVNINDVKYYQDDSPIQVPEGTVVTIYTATGSSGSQWSGYYVDNITGTSYTYNGITTRASFVMTQDCNLSLLALDSTYLHVVTRTPL